jgi:hypothetical protein
MCDLRVRPIVCVNSVLAIPAAISLIQGLRNAFRGSYDFQWSGAHLTLLRVDPYHLFLIHDPQHLMLLSQVPNYLHELYILFLPLGWLSFPVAKSIWAVLNCAFAVLAPLVLGRIYALEKAQTLLIFLLLVASTPFRIVLGGGQLSMFELLLFSLVFYAEKQTRELKQGIFLGLSYSKYSFSPVVFLYFAFRRRFRLLAISLIPPLLSLLAMWFLVRGNIVTLATEPFLVNRTGITDGLGDLMALTRTTFKGVVHGSALGLLTYIFAISAGTAYAFFLSRRGDVSPQFTAPVLAVASLAFFPHLTYDYVFLIIPLAACLSGPMQRAKALVLTEIALLWFAIRLVPIDTLDRMAMAQMVIFPMLLVMLYLLGRREFSTSTLIPGS